MSIKKIKIRLDCFGFEWGDRCKPTCKALSHLVCAQEECGFYKTKFQYENECEKYARKRINPRA